MREQQALAVPASRDLNGLFTRTAKTASRDQGRVAIRYLLTSTGSTIEHADAGMTSSVPWQIRGVSLHTREAAREAARRSGISVGEWLDRAILDSAFQDGVDPRRCMQLLSDPHGEPLRAATPAESLLGMARA